MKAERVRAGSGEFAMFRLAGDSPAGSRELIWAHGWGQTHASLLPLAEAMRRRAPSLLLDLPGFGASPPPPIAWSTADYADAAAEWLTALAAAQTPSPASGGGRGWGPSDGGLHRPHPDPPPPAGEGNVRAVAPRRRIWVAHSFGCRVGLQLAARHPDAVAGLFLVAAPGLPPTRSPWRRGRMLARLWAYRLLRQLTPEGPARERLRARFGSSDYLQASPLMRQVLVKAVNEDLSGTAQRIRVPVVLVYGDRDQDAPPDIGRRLESLIPRARLVVLRGFGHLDILTDGRHQLIQRLGEFVEQVT
jgi:pimeloyl-ACP methyl ester carboxylesterase